MNFNKQMLFSKLYQVFVYKYNHFLATTNIISGIKKSKGLINGNVRLNILGNFYCGNYCILNGGGIDSFPLSIYVANGADLKIGNNVGISQTSIYCKLAIEIGDYVKIGAGCLIFDSNFHSTDWKMRSDRSKDTLNAKNAPVKIGNYAFIGARCIITKGVTIGERSIISAGSVVVENVPSDCIAGGNPCKIIKFINSKES